MEYQQLKGRWWYRLLSVIYVLSFLIVLGMTILIVYDDNKIIKKIDYYYSHLYCKTEKPDYTLVAKKIKKLYPGSYDGIPDKILGAKVEETYTDLFAYPGMNLDELRKRDELKYDSFLRVELGDYTDQKLRFLCYEGFLREYTYQDTTPSLNYSLDIKYFPEDLNEYIRLIGYLILSVAIVIAIFLVIRSTFLYISTGKFTKNRV